MTLLDGLDPEAAASREELFAPILTFFEARDYTEALSLTNHSKYGLTASIFTSDLGRALDFAENAEVGVVKVNEPTIGLDAHVPTGGWKHSGSGPRELGKTTVDFFSEEKTVYLRPQLGALK